MRSKKKKYKEFGRFILIPTDVLESEIFRKRVGSNELKLLIDLLLQYYGDNNGCLSPCYSLMKKRGWSKSSLHRAFCNLIHSGFLVVTRQGRKVRGYATLVAITWLPIDEPKSGKSYDEGIKPSDRSLGYWCKVKSSWSHLPECKDYNKPIPPD